MTSVREARAELEKKLLAMEIQLKRMRSKIKLLNGSLNRRGNP